MKKVSLFLILTLSVIELIAQVRVSGHYRSNGTYVQPHYRSSPDNTPTNNYSYPGNTNPYTGKVATGNPDTYQKNYNNSNSTNRSDNSTYKSPSSTYTSPNSGGSYYNSSSSSSRDYSGTPNQALEKQDESTNNSYMPTRAIVRTEPSAYGKEVFRLDKGTSVYLLEKINDFYKVRIHNTIGYVSYLFIDLLNLVTPGSSSQAVRNTVYTQAKVDTKAIFRQEPSANASVAGEIPADTHISIEGKVGDYYYINYQGINGYIHDVWLSQKK